MQKNFLYLITFAYAFSMFAQGILTPIYAFFVQNIGGGILETSWAIAVYSIITGLGTIAIHHTAASHKYSRHLLWGGWLLWLLSVGIYLIMSNVVMLYISQCLNGLGVALSEPIFDAEFSKKITADPAGGWALFEGISSIFYGLASIAGGFIATAYGFDALLYCMFGVALGSFILIVYYTHAQRIFTAK